MAATLPRARAPDNLTNSETITDDHSRRGGRPMPADVLTWLSGPEGGMVAAAFAAGAMGAWGFAMRLCNQRLGTVQRQITDLSTEVHRLREEVYRWQRRADTASDELLTHLRRQLAQQDIEEAAKILGQKPAVSVPPKAD